jgi:hypothetical protein
VLFFQFHVCFAFAFFLFFVCVHLLMTCNQKRKLLKLEYKSKNSRTYMDHFWHIHWIFPCIHPYPHQVTLMLQSP